MQPEPQKVGASDSESISGKLDWRMSPRLFFGAELKYQRRRAHMTQQELGAATSYCGGHVGLIEQGRRLPPPGFAERCDELFGTDGLLTRLAELARYDRRFPTWFQSFTELEATATEIYSFEAQTVPGLLQTEEYARAMLGAVKTSADVLEERVAARMSRQQILGKPDAPLLWVVMDEAVLHRPVGGNAVMRAQIQRLIEFATLDQIVIQVLPVGIGAHAGLDGPFVLLTLADRHEVAYIEGPGRGHLIETPDMVAQYRFRYDLLRATALPVDASVALMAAAMEGL